MSGIFSGEDVFGPASQTPIVIFDSLACVSGCSMGLFILTARLNPNIRRTRAWYIMFITLTVFPLLYLTNAGYQFQSEAPPFGLCLFQAALVYAGPPTATLAVFCYMLDVALSVYTAMRQKTRSKLSFQILSWLPSAMFLLVYTIAVMAVTSTESVAFDSAHMFCGAGAGSLHARIAASLTILSLAGMLIVEVWIIVMLVKVWRNRQLLSRSSHALQISVAVRFGIFTALVGVAGVLTAFIIPENQYAGAIWNIFLITAPFLGGLAFGTHRDMLHTWACWIMRRPLLSQEHRRPADPEAKPE